MPVPNILLSLVTEENDYQRAQADAARSAARQFGVNVEVVYAENDAVLQVQQVLRILQARYRAFDAIIAEPVGTPMEQAARLAAEIGVIWGILNRETGYIASTRTLGTATQFEVTNDHFEIGRIQGEQAAALLPFGGVALYVEGPAASGAARLRAEGMMATKPTNLELKVLRGDWTQASAARTATSWLRLGTSRKLGIGAIFCQNDAMAMGVRDAITQTLSGSEREDWMSLPITGCDGLPKGGQDYVRLRHLAATVKVPTNADRAIEMVARALRGEAVPAHTKCAPASFPALSELHEHIGTVVG